MSTARLTELLTYLRHGLNVGCSDHHCQLYARHGMGTNGGCKCLRNIGDMSLEVAAEIERMANRRPEKPLLGDRP